MAGKRVKTTKFEIIQVASEFFLSVGYSATSPKMIANELEISTGNITYYFPTKEHLLLELVEMLCDFQWELIKKWTGNGVGTISSICLEMMMVVSGCAENDIARDFFTAVFQSEMCRNYLRKNHEERAKTVFAKECAEWTDEQFTEAELLIMGLQYTSVVATDANVSVERKALKALDHILSIYNVGEEVRKAEIEKVVSSNYKKLGKLILGHFIKYVEDTNMQKLENMLRGKRRKQITDTSRLEVSV